MEQVKLIEARKSRGYTQKQMALKIAMEQTTYSRKERGKSPISNEEWDRLAKILEVPVEDIKEINNITNSKNENCVFHDQSIGIQIVSMPQNAFDMIVKYNQKLEIEIDTLKQENQQLKNL